MFVVPEFVFWQKMGPGDLFAEQEVLIKLQTHPGWPEIPIFLTYAGLGDAKVCCYRFI